MSEAFNTESGKPEVQAPEQPYVPLQMNKEQRALFSAGMPVTAVHKLQPAVPVKEEMAKPTRRDQPQPVFVNSILDNGQRLLAIVGKERRLIKLL